MSTTIQNNSTSSQVWFITGTSTGLGRSIAKYALSQGYRVVATARDVSKIQDLVQLNPRDVLALKLDVTSKSDIQTAITSAVSHFGRIDVLINNAGFAIFRPIEETTDEQTRSQFETNFFGALAVTQTVLPIMRKQKSGTIVQISSVVGSLAFPATGAYAATKFALEAVSEALAQEVAAFGIKVLIAEPGSFRTSVIKEGETFHPLSEPYKSGPAADTIHYFESSNGKQPGDPDKIGKAIDDALKSPNPPLRLSLGSDSYNGILAHKTKLLEEHKTWEQVSRSTDYN